MSIETSAKIVFGVPANQIKPKILERIMEEELLDRISPYYDADTEDCLYGVTLFETDYYKTPFDEFYTASALNAAKVKVLSITGETGSLYLAKDVW